MSKTFIGPKLRQLRISRELTQADVAQRLGVSAAYVNLLENNQRSLSVKMLLAISEAFDVDVKELTQDDGAHVLADLRNAFSDTTLEGAPPDVQELRSAIERAPAFVDHFLQLHRAHRAALRVIMRGEADGRDEQVLHASPETAIHDFFRKHNNYFAVLEVAAENARRVIPVASESLFVDLRAGLRDVHGVSVEVRPIEELGDSLRIYDQDSRTLLLSQALNNENRAFQMAHILAFLTEGRMISKMAKDAQADSERVRPRLEVELGNYFAAAFLMPYEEFLATAERTGYDIDRIALAFGVTFEQACHRLTTMQRDKAHGIPFFLLRLDRAGNVTKRFNASSFDLAEYGGACPVWNVHAAFSVPGVIFPQFVEMPDGQRFFSISRTVHRPVFSADTQDRRLTLTLGCEARHAHRIRYAASFKIDDHTVYHPIGINCQLCPRQACSQRAHQPLFINLPINANRRGSTRYES
ncbi:helix-turn-helix domain-containing protein [Roseovarius sp. B08]|uniref:helix-turn-helix domain-containing protein n=1 Tax=Roseovarius sp. B08 TaxID=3449223 RepID=UPI003EDBC906